ncbi:PilN domain-containing protein [Vulcaniibacterium gelatinicum]|uniref:PilN domain-containing protein n=1 Tax=Vulcaniibacterium gelatinicum TaxID=2598725 RepID=UPI0011C721A1|nr:PilN domain-containing protein [Vulcaniibacterium gelatinicum]
MSALRESVSRLQTRIRPGAGGFFAWWARALAAWLPARWRQALRAGQERLLLVEQADGLLLRRQHAEGMDDLGRLPAAADLAFAEDALGPLLGPAVADLPRWLLLPAGAGLRRTLTLPAAAAERLREVVAFEIERQTPFAADAVAFDARVLGRRGEGQIEAELVVVPRATLQAQLQGLGPLAATLSGVDLADSAGMPLDVNLLPPAQRVRRSDPWRTWNIAFAAVALVALVAGLWQVLDNRRAAVEALQARVKALEGPAARAAAQRQRLADAVAGQVYLDRLRAGRPSAIEVMDELSRRLPDSTYLEKLAIEGDRLLLIGLSSEASALVARLEGSKLWRAPALTGALQPDPRTRRDRFTLTAELAVTAPPKEAADAGNARAGR